MALQVESNPVVPGHFKRLDQGGDAGGFNGRDVSQIHGDRMRQWCAGQDDPQTLPNVRRRINIDAAFQADDGVRPTLIYGDFDVAG